MRTDPFDLTGRVALVAGAGSVGSGYSNGRAISVVLARWGARVVALDLHLDRAEETCSIINNEGGECQPMVGDVTLSESLSAVRQKLVEQDSEPELLVCNAGGSAPGDCLSVEEDVWDRQIEFNLKSVFLLTRTFLPGMIQRRCGAIVNIGSVAGVRGTGDLIAYSSAKAGMHQFSKQIALRHAKDGVRCNVVVPGIMHTPLVESRLVEQRGVDDAEDFINRRNSYAPMGEMGTAWDVAHATHFLLSNAASYITGAVLMVDGGASLVTYR